MKRYGTVHPHIVEVYLFIEFVTIVRICDTCLFFVTCYAVDFLLLFEEKQRTHHTNVLFIWICCNFWIKVWGFIVTHCVLFILILLFDHFLRVLCFLFRKCPLFFIFTKSPNLVTLRWFSATNVKLWWTMIKKNP